MEVELTPYDQIEKQQKNLHIDSIDTNAPAVNVKGHGKLEESKNFGNQTVLDSINSR